MYGRRLRNDLVLKEGLCMNTLLRGPILITESQTLDLSKFGIKIGDHINVICVGGGGGGGTNYATSDPYNGKVNYGYGAGVSGADLDATGGYYYPNAGGGGSGFVSYKTITVDTLSVDITIGQVGANGTKSTNVTTASGKAGTATSFGSYLSAAGGNGGKSLNDSSSTSGYWSMAGGTGGTGGNNGSGGDSSSHSSSSGYKLGKGGAGGLGFVPKGPFLIGTGENSGIRSGSGCVMIWY
jgi:hypothetical protein